MKNLKTIIFASLITAMILPFSGMNYALAEESNNIRDKTTDIKNHEKILLDGVEIYKNHMEKILDLNDKLIDPNVQSYTTLKNQLDNEKAMLAEFIAQNKAENTIPEKKLTKLMKQQAKIEEKVIQKNLQRFITSIGIDTYTQEIQIGLDANTVNSGNKDRIINKIDQIIPNKVQWHIVLDTQRMSLDNCTNEKYCSPLLGGNTVKINTGGICSNGFQATIGGIFGFVTAGHCADNKVGKTVVDYQDDLLGTVKKETFYWGTECDCTFIEASSSQTDNKTYLSQGTQQTITSYTSSIYQGGDYIIKSGAGEYGINYGVITGLNKSNFGYDSSIGWFWIRGLVESTAQSMEGDSGGTVIGDPQSSSLYGIISGGDGNTKYYHVPIDKIISKLGIAPILG